MNEEDKIAWIDEENKIVSFHAIDDGKMIIKAESLFWDFLFGLTESGYQPESQSSSFLLERWVCICSTKTLKWCR